MHNSSQSHVEGHPNVNYFMIFMALCACTVLSVAFDLVHLPSVVLVTLVLAVAVAKAMFVMTYFMHLKFEGKWKYIILSPTTILAVGLVIGLAPDIAMQYYVDDTPQARLAADRQADASHPKTGAATHSTDHVPAK
ncbi:cytochrome C oxidase subunit IV family protein [Planctomicrobium sp. SH527]|uniref:cytochrome C oxidase subunit IV family protein n=1 Tax=Planctomicrobium sp. SH527 TaxID=3448123 RepID=UPI003F5C07BC